MATDADEHRYFEGMAVSHVLGGLDESDGRVFRSHLLECSDCRAHVGELRALAHDLADAERDERRVRAARSVETKRRETADGDGDEHHEAAPPPPWPLRHPRLILLVSVVALVGLASWNFMLRSTVAQQQAKVDNVMEAAEVLEYGTEVSVTPQSIDATAKVRDDKLVLRVADVNDDTRHAILQLDGDGRYIPTREPPLWPTDERIFALVSLEHETRELVLARYAGGDEPRRVLTVMLP